MEAFVKSFSTYRTVKKAAVISSALVLDSLDRETSTVTVVGTGIGRSDTGNWLVIDGSVYKIYNVKPQKDRTLLTLTSPLDAFSRPLELSMQTASPTIGGFVAAALRENWIQCEDPTYATAYLIVSNSDTSAYVDPELDSGGCFSLSDYCRLMRKSYRTTVRFVDAGSRLSCIISRPPAASRNISFEDGRSQLQSVDYSSSGVSKITVLYTQEDDNDTENPEDYVEVSNAAGGTTVIIGGDGDHSEMVAERSDWYLSEDGTVSQTIPARRAAGEWTTITVSKAEDIRAKVVEAFAKNKANHKLEFWSTRDISVQDDCEFFVHGELLQSYISYKRKSSEDKRFYYKSGELAVTATEKLRGVLK